MDDFIITPKVDETQEFIEIANDFSNPLELVREAISNSFDANADKIKIVFTVIKEYGEKILQITIEDNGDGMDREGLQSFFDLGNSLRRDDTNSIGEKGHGTKVYFNSTSIEVISSKSGNTLRAYVDEPYKKLFDREIPKVEVRKISKHESQGTTIIIKGYNNNRRSKFTHEQLKDYIIWFTKFGSVELEFGIEENKNIKLMLQGLNRDEPEVIEFGHYFPDESKSVEDLFEEYLVRAPKHYCKRIIKEGQLNNFPEIKYQAVFSVEGNKVKQKYNPMLRRRGFQAPSGAYTVQERYGIWLCKDFIPIQRKNDWVTKKGSEYIKFHAFFNCQDLKLTANRGSVDNTPYEIMQDIKAEVKKIYNEITVSDEWRELEWLESEADAFRTAEREKKDFEWRVEKVNKANIAKYEGVTLVQPERETGVFALFLKLSLLKPKLFPFKILDYDTHSGIDVIVKGDKSLSIYQSKLFYVEFKYFLIKQFNHSFENLHSIICWDIDIKNGEIIEDVNNEERKLKIVSPENENDYVRYFLEASRSAHRIEVYVLKDYLKQKLGIDFRPRTDADIE
ncbi:MAG: ATP-binding protein [Eubacteriales bacterium]